MKMMKMEIPDEDGWFVHLVFQKGGKGRDMGVLLKEGVGEKAILEKMKWIYFHMKEWKKDNL